MKRESTYGIVEPLGPLLKQRASGPEVVCLRQSVRPRRCRGNCLPSVDARARRRSNRAMPHPRFDRRRVLKAGALAGLVAPALAFARGLPAMTDGPFYPSIAYRARALDWDADLTTVRGRAPDG